MSKRSEKKLVTDVLNTLKTSLERIRVAHNTFSCFDTNSRGTLRRIVKKMSFFQEMLQKNSVWRRKASVFVKLGFASPAMELLELLEEMERDFSKKKHLSSDK